MAVRVDRFALKALGTGKLRMSAWPAEWYPEREGRPVLLVVAFAPSGYISNSSFNMFFRAWSSLGWIMESGARSLSGSAEPAISAWRTGEIPSSGFAEI